MPESMWGKQNPLWWLLAQIVQKLFQNHPTVPSVIPHRAVSKPLLPMVKSLYWPSNLFNSMGSPLASLQDYKPSLFNTKPYYLLGSLIVFLLFIAYSMNIPFTVIFVIYGIVPLADQYASKDWTNPTLKEVKQLENQPLFKVVLYVTVFLKWTSYFLIHVLIREVSLIKGAGILMLGITLFGTGFLLSHELIHKNLVDKVVGTLDQIPVFYAHFTIQHVYGHHRKVATPEDPASAPKGMTVYRFMVKSIGGSYKSSFKIAPVWTSIFTASYLLFSGFIQRKFGWFGLMIAMIIGLGSIGMLEIINYVQHYGLYRKLREDGTYQKVTVRHSWNAANMVSNFLLFKLQRHSDHHQNAKKPYQTLCSYQDSPQLPHGYIVCMMMAMFPSVWFDVMDPLVDQYANDPIVKGTELKHYNESQTKTKAFVRRLVYVTGAVAGVQLLEAVLRKTGLY